MRSPLACILVAVLAGCSSSPADAPAPRPSSAEAAYDETAVRDGLADLFAGDDPRPRDVRAGQCFADRLLKASTPQQLRSGGLVASDGGAVTELPTLSAPLAEQVADAQLACIEVVDSSTRALTAVRKGDLDAEAYARCLRQALPRSAQRAALVATLTGQWEDPALQRLARAQVGCVDEQDR